LKFEDKDVQCPSPFRWWNDGIDTCSTFIFSFGWWWNWYLFYIYF